MKVQEASKNYFANKLSVFEPPKPIECMNPQVYRFIVNNCFDVLNISSISESNVNHIIDALMAYREAFHYLELGPLVEMINFCLDEVIRVVPNITGENRTKYKDNLYSVPNQDRISFFFN